MLTGRAVADLTRDYLDALARVGQLPHPLAQRLRAYHRFVEKTANRLARYPQELTAVACAEPLDSLVRQGVWQPPARPWFRLLNPPATDPTRR